MNVNACVTGQMRTNISAVHNDVLMKLKRHVVAKSKKTKRSAEAEYVSFVTSAKNPEKLSSTRKTL